MLHTQFFSHLISALWFMQINIVIFSLYTFFTYNAFFPYHVQQCILYINIIQSAFHVYLLAMTSLLAFHPTDIHINCPSVSCHMYFTALSLICLCQCHSCSFSSWLYLSPAFASCIHLSIYAPSIFYSVPLVISHIMLLEWLRKAVVLSSVCHTLHFCPCFYCSSIVCHTLHLFCIPIIFFYVAHWYRTYLYTITMPLSSIPNPSYLFHCLSVNWASCVQFTLSSNTACHYPVLNSYSFCPKQLECLGHIDFCHLVISVILPWISQMHIFYLKCISSITYLSHPYQ